MQRHSQERTASQYEPLSNTSDEEPFTGGARSSLHFARAMRGYNRNDVDLWIASNHRPARELMARSAAAIRRVHDLEARLSELESSAADTPPLQSLADTVLERASEVARGLQRHVVSQAETERDEIRKIAAEEIEAAEVRSAEIVAEAKRDHEEVASMMDEARKQVGLFLQQGKAMARERARATWAEAAGTRSELSFELQRLEEQRQAVLGELAQSRRAVAASKKLLGEKGTRTAARRKRPA